MDSDSDDFEVHHVKSSFFDGLCQGSKLTEKEKNLRQKVKMQSEIPAGKVLSLQQKISKRNQYRQNVSVKVEEMIDEQFANEKILVDTSSNKNGQSINGKPAQKALKQKSFQDLRIIRPLLKAVSDNEYVKPTPIQQQSIPVILSGKDVVASSITGSGKTAAFLLPIIQRYFHAAAVGYIRALIVTPTRQLAIQIHEEFQKLNKYTKLQACLVIGGSSIQRQEQMLRNNPELVISTPGRIIDLLMNSRSVGIENLQMIVFDEADKMLEMGFEAQVKQIMSHTHSEVQTVLFSATISKQVSKLTAITSKKPIRVSADPDHVNFLPQQIQKTAELLHQQIVKLKDQSEQYREAVLVSILKNLYQQKVIVFFKTKKQCHRIAIVMGLLGMQTCELHGNLSQTQRIQAFLDFKEGKYNYMLATDLAARGLDIKQVKTVINYELPIQLTRYIHRIGRTARAGSIGTSLTLCGDQECLQLKKMSKKTGDKLFKLNVKDQSVQKMQSQIRSMNKEIEEIYNEQRQERFMRKAEMQIQKAQNIQDHQDEIYNRPKRQWFMSEKQKKKIQEGAMRAVGIEPSQNEKYSDPREGNRGGRGRGGGRGSDRLSKGRGGGNKRDNRVQTKGGYFKSEKTSDNPKDRHKKRKFIKK